MEENKENVVEETTQETVQTVDETKFETAGDESVLKVDLNNPPKTKEDAVQKQSTDEVPVRDGSETSGEVQEKNEEVVEEITGEDKKEVSEKVSDEQPVIEEITEEQVEEKVEELVEETKEAIVEAQETGKDLPENIQKLVDFMEDTGGDITDYVRLNQDYTQFSDDAVLREYYRQTKKHLSEEEINFLMEDSFSYDEEEETEREIKRKKLALKEQVASARAHLDGQKSKYYEEIKAGSKLTKEQQKAINFFNRYNKESEENNKIVEKQTNTFLNKTNEVFNDFKGFEYKVGDKRYRFNVKDVDKVKENQSDINNFVKKFLNENNEMSDAIGYHKSLFTAMNSDAIANHFYEQGKADALKETIAKSKNVNMDPRKVLTNENTSGPKVRILDDKTQPTFRVKKQI